MLQQPEQIIYLNLLDNPFIWGWFYMQRKAVKIVQRVPGTPLLVPRMLASCPTMSPLLVPSSYVANRLAQNALLAPPMAPFPSQDQFLAPRCSQVSCLQVPSACDSFWFSLFVTTWTVLSSAGQYHVPSPGCFVWISLGSWVLGSIWQVEGCPITSLWGREGRGYTAPTWQTPPDGFLGCFPLLALVSSVTNVMYRFLFETLFSLLLEILHHTGHCIPQTCFTFFKHENIFFFSAMLSSRFLV